MVADFRKEDADTPVILMGYFNPIYSYGVEPFLRDAKAAGVDGLIVVDLPPEEDDELCLPALSAGLAFIRLATPTTDDARLPAVLTNTSGFVYYVSITGVTGSATPDPDVVGKAVKRVKRHTKLPVAVGFGVRDAASAAAIGSVADGVAVGSAIVEAVRTSLADGKASSATVGAVSGWCARSPTPARPQVAGRRREKSWRSGTRAPSRSVAVAAASPPPAGRRAPACPSEEARGGPLGSKVAGSRRAPTRRHRS